MRANEARLLKSSWSSEYRSALRPIRAKEARPIRANEARLPMRANDARPIRANDARLSSLLTSESASESSSASVAA